MATKWDLLTEKERSALERVPFRDFAGQPGKCSKCGMTLFTEADFAQHFVLYDRTHLNLGYCPFGGV